MTAVRIAVLACLYDMPWYVWTSLASIASILIGGYWDISWHMTIGRDSFWTPAHIAIQMGGIIAGTAGTYQILAATLRRSIYLRNADALLRAPAEPGLADGVRVWGFRGPLGAFVAVWGAATMVISAPFDNWWHDAYGLDVKILSPPHVVLTLGILGVATGGVLQMVRALNRSEVPASIDRLLLVAAGMTVTMGMSASLELTFRAALHHSMAYRAVATNIPLLLLVFARVSRHRWAATIIAGTYTTFMIAMLWLFPLFPAEPKLGPVYQPITHMVPLQFPILIVVPAIALDLARARLAHWPRWRMALVLGPLFVATLLAAEWPFAAFLMTEHAQNWVFGSHYQPYFAHPDWHEVRHEFFTDPDFASGMVRAVAYAIAGSFLGLVLGDAMKKVKR